MAQLVHNTHACYLRITTNTLQTQFLLNAPNATLTLIQFTSILPFSFSTQLSHFFCGRRPLPFGGSHLRLPSGPAGIRTTTGSLSALARPTPYQLSHRVALTQLSHLILRTSLFSFFVVGARCLSAGRT